MNASATCPHSLRLDAMPVPVISDNRRPRFSWLSDQAGSEARLEVWHDGELIWDSGFVFAQEQALVYSGPTPSSRTKYNWRVKSRSTSGVESEWSAFGRWETGLLSEADWTAFWISRAVPAATRPIRMAQGDHIDWAIGGESIGQQFETTGPISGVSVCLTGERNAGTACTLEIVDAASLEIIGSRRLTYFPHDRFSHWVGLDRSPPPGAYVARIVDVEGRVGWLSCREVPQAPADDGVSALLPVGPAIRDGQRVDGMRTIAVETEPDCDPHLFKEFSIAGPVTDARLYAVGLGYGNFRLNGEPVWNGVLEPAPTMYEKRIHYRAYDVTALLREGPNRIDAILGRGFYATRGINEWGWQVSPWHREPCLRLQLEITLADGTHTTLGSDSSWSAQPSGIVSDRLLNGEIHESGEPRSPVTQAVEVQAPSGRLEAANLPPILRHGTIAAKSATQKSNGTVYDFGEITAGWVRAKITGGEGGSVSLVYCETLDEDGNAHVVNIHAHGAPQRDRYLTSDRDEAGSVWEPMATYKGFRYVQALAEGGAAVTQIEAVPLHNDVQGTGTFSCSSETLTWIDDALKTAFLNNLHGIPTDTPVYEKNGWTADAHLATEAVLHHFDLHAFLIKWLRDHADAQDKDGSIPQIIPTPGWGCALDPTWSASYPLIAWNVYFEYGDRTVLEEHFEGIIAYVDLLHRVAEPQGWIWQRHSWADWLAPGYAWPPEGPSPTATMMMLRSTQRAAMICEALGKTDKAAQLRVTAGAIANAYHAKYFDAGVGAYVSEAAGYRQTMNVLPLAFEAVPSDEICRVVASLAGDLSDHNDEHLNVGAVGVKHLLPVLSAHGHHELALTVAMQPTRPGWGVWKEAGSNTLWESWDPKARSRNHYFLGSIGQWLHEDVAGLTPTSPGWKTFDVVPKRDARIDWAKIDHASVRGGVALEWSANDTATRMLVTVPPGSSARVRVPSWVEKLAINDRVSSRADAPEITLQEGAHEITMDGRSSRVAAVN